MVHHIGAPISFLLTRPSRGATLEEGQNMQVTQFLLTRPSRGATTDNVSGENVGGISTHTPLAGRDETHTRVIDAFQISTHTPLAGRDSGSPASSGRSPDFYSHAPRGARLNAGAGHVIEHGFLLTRPSRGATISCFKLCFDCVISTHTPLAGRDHFLMFPTT